MDNINENKKIFADGISFSPPSDITKEKAPWVRGKVSIIADKLIPFIEKYKNERGWVNLDLKKSESGVLYLELNTWKPEPKAEEINPNDINF